MKILFQISLTWCVSWSDSFCWLISTICFLLDLTWVAVLLQFCFTFESHYFNGKISIHGNILTFFHNWINFFSGKEALREGRKPANVCTYWDVRSRGHWSLIVLKGFCCFCQFCDKMHKGYRKEKENPRQSLQSFSKILYIQEFRN